MIHRQYYSVQEHYANGKGQRNIVTIKNGKATKTVEKLGAKGRILKSKTRKLTKKEQTNVLEKKFMPSFWSNCRFGNCRKTQ